MRRNTAIFFAAVLASFLPAYHLGAATYHVDSQGGDDARNGLSPAQAWRSLE